MPSTDLAKETLAKVLELRDFIGSVSIEASGCKNPKSLLNMLHYLKLREVDNTSLQDDLSRLGLSSLGRSQGNILYSLDLLVEILSRCNGLDFNRFEWALSIDEADEIRARRATIFGGEPKPKKREETKIMLTLPSEAASDTSMIEEFANAGVGLFRINTALDDAAAWRAMAEKIQELNQNLHPQNRLKIYVDLAGPKIRTGKIRKVPSALKLNPLDKVYIVAEEKEFVKIPSGALRLITDEKFYKKAKKAKKIEVISKNGRSRTLKITDTPKGYIECEVEKKTLIDKDTILSVGKKEKTVDTSVLNLPQTIEDIRLFDGDLLFLSLEEIEGHGKITGHDGTLVSEAAIFCTQKEFVKDAKIGDKVYIDDGKIGLEVIEKRCDGLLCKTVQAKAKGESLKEEKGINFPDSNVSVGAITDEDIKNLADVVAFADIIGVSFAQNRGDIERVREELSALAKEHIAIVAKIETKQAVRNLPCILEALMYHELSGIMLARGDLAIEVGFENMSYLQEEILDLCEAAHTPVIFATQVLENQMKNNLPSRAEITDAAYSQRADCVMLNKGAFAVNTIKKLDFILSRMHTIYKKNRLLLDSCDIWKA